MASWASADRVYLGLLAFRAGLSFLGSFPRAVVQFERLDPLEQRLLARDLVLPFSIRQKLRKMLLVAVLRAFEGRVNDAVARKPVQHSQGFV